MPAARFWQLRVDEGFDHYFAELDAQTLEMLRFDESFDSAGGSRISRAYKLNLKKNPVPLRLRKMMGKSDFAFTIQASFHKDQFDELHPCALLTRWKGRGERKGGGCACTEERVLTSPVLLWEERRGGGCCPCTGRVRAGIYSCTRDDSVNSLHRYDIDPPSLIMLLPAWLK